MTTARLDPEKLEKYQGMVAGAAHQGMHCALSFVGDQLGLYAALREISPATSSELAAKTGLSERWVREWLYQQACCGLDRLLRGARRLRARTGGGRSAGRPESRFVPGRHVRGRRSAQRRRRPATGELSHRYRPVVRGSRRCLRVRRSPHEPAVPGVPARGQSTADARRRRREAGGRGARGRRRLRHGDVDDRDGQGVPHARSSSATTTRRPPSSEPRSRSRRAASTTSRSWIPRTTLSPRTAASISSRPSTSSTTRPIRPSSSPPSASRCRPRAPGCAPTSKESRRSPRTSPTTRSRRSPTRSRS